MREDVAIVLNEREPAKARAAEQFAARLSDKLVTSIRLPIDGKIMKTVVARAPRVIVVDYLLGDHATGLDLLHAVAELQPQPAVFFLTDEPSVPVAVAALKGGALDYFELDSPRSLMELCDAVTSHLHSSTSPSRKRSAPPSTARLEDLVALTPPMMRIVTELQSTLRQPNPTIILTGAPGVGLSTLGRAALSDVFSDQGWIELDLQRHPRLPRQRDDIITPETPFFIDNAEADGGALLAMLIKLPASRRPPLVVTTHSHEEALVWQTALHASLLEVPPLTTRKGEIATLCERFISDLSALLQKRVRSFSAEQLRILEAHQWPENLRELRSITWNVLTSAQSERTDVGDLLRQALADSNRLLPPPVPVDYHTALREFELSGFNLHLTSLRFGISPRALWGILHPSNVPSPSGGTTL